MPVKRIHRDDLDMLTKQWEELIDNERYDISDAVRMAQDTAYMLGYDRAKNMYSDESTI